MRLSLRQLQVFLGIAETGTTSAAGQKIALSQSATSAALNELEAALQVQLFDRVGKGLLLNENGRLLLPQAHLVLDAVRSMEAQFTQPDAAWPGLRIAASTTIGNYYLPDLFAHLQSTVAASKTSGLPSLFIGNTGDVVQRIENYAADIGFIEGECHQAGIVVEPWLQEQLIVVCHPQHALAQAAGQRCSVSDLQKEAWLLREAGSGTRETVEQYLSQQLQSFRCAGELGNSEAIKYAVAAGLGLSCLSVAVVQELLAAGRLIQLHPEFAPCERRFSLIYHAHKAASAQLAHFLRLVRGWSSGLQSAAPGEAGAAN